MMVMDKPNISNRYKPGVGVLNAICIVLEYLEHSEMGGKYDPDDPYSGTHDTLTELKDKVMGEL